ncbi:hypothetical protein N798_13835 [Knoellia flava TL1]|uniref:DUF559 domain-containing protein n=2 Tax=Knoellia flava TaxID=913969 RepID=A0A8H9KQ42_9MICO|nr:hypothetical protein N798_13835 [Knoellia flava TL1]GGB75080.1 hypothetical protein GCM10011314_13240 [Knoellia flava]
MHRADLRRMGVTRHDVRAELEAGRWASRGRHTIRVLSVETSARADLWTAVWESGWGAVLDGAAALVAQGMVGFAPSTIDVALPKGSTKRRVEGVTTHERREVGPVVGSGLPRTRPEHALVRAAQWARTDRQAALLICLPVQQRLVRPESVVSAWALIARSPRRALIGSVIADVCDGAHSLGELDFTRLCRARGLPPPVRQSVRSSPSGRVYLDVEWEGLVVEIDGGHHFAGLNPMDDAFRANEVVLDGTPVLRLPVLGLRLRPDLFMAQVARAVERYVLPRAA